MPEIIIVEDDLVLQDVYEASLSAAGYHICAQAFNGQAAVDALLGPGPRPDVIIMDHRMPVMSGLEAASEILRHDPASRIVFVSADSSVREAALAAGALAFLPKPFALLDLVRLLSRLLDVASPIRGVLSAGGALAP